jgi:hypothetical protein
VRDLIGEAPLFQAADQHSLGLRSKPDHNGTQRIVIGLVAGCKNANQLISEGIAHRAHALEVDQDIATASRELLDLRSDLLPGEAIATIIPLGPAYPFLQRLADCVLVNHKLGVAFANVLGDPDPLIADAEHDLAQSVSLSSTGCDNTPRRADAVLNRVLTELADRHQDRIADDGDIIELVDQGLQQPVGEAIDFGQLDQARRSKDHLDVAAGKCFIDAADALPQAEGPKIPARRLIKRLFDVGGRVTEPAT